MKVERLSKTHVRFIFDVTVDEFEHGLDHAFEHVVKDVSLKGFRKGKVPRNIYENKFGVESLYEEAINHILQHKHHEAIHNPDFVIVGRPKVNLEYEDIKRGESFELSFDVSVKPDVALGEYKGIEVELPAVLVTDEEIDAEINSLLAANSVLEPKEGNLEKGDTAIFDFEGFKDGVPFEGGKAENYSLEIGSNQFIPGFEDGMIGMKQGEQRDVHVVFPEQYQAEELAGRPVVFKVLLHEVKSKKTAELNDEWVKTLDKGVETVDQLKEQIRVKALERKNAENENIVADTVITKIIEGSSVELPEEMVEEEMQHLKENIEAQAKQYNIEFEMFLTLNGMTLEQYEEFARKEAERRILMSLVIEEVAKKESITATEEEINEKYDELAKKYNMPLDDIKKYLPKEALSDDIALNKAYEFVVKSAVRK